MQEKVVVICPIVKNRTFPKCCEGCAFAIKTLDTNKPIGCAIRKNVRLLSDRQKLGRKSLNKVNNLKRRMMNGNTES